MKKVHFFLIFYLATQTGEKHTKRLLSDIRQVIKRNATAKTESLIYQLNPKLRGWAFYYRHVCSKQTFSYIDYQLFKALWCWAKRRHPKKSQRWIRQKYFRSQGNRHWVFSTKIKDKQGNRVELDLVETSKVAIKRHIKIRAAAQPYDPTYQEYFRQRQQRPKYRVS